MTPNYFIHPNPAAFDVVGHQNFPLPFGIISYITQNPKSANGLLNLQKTCKYFFLKNKIIFCDKDFWQRNNELYCYTIHNLYGRKICFDDYINKFKFWLVEGLTSDGKTPLQIPKYIYRCTLNYLYIPKQNLTLNEIDFLMDGGKITWLNLWNTNMTNSDGALVSLDQILLKVPIVERLDYYCEEEIYTNETFENIKILTPNSKWNEVKILITKVSPNIDITLLCNFIRMNATEETCYSFLLKTDDGNNELYEKIVQEAFDKIIENYETKYVKPEICFG